MLCMLRSSAFSASTFTAPSMKLMCRHIRELNNNTPNKMIAENPIHSESISARLADHLSAMRDDILTDWKSKVSQDPSIRCDGIEDQRFLGVMPQILDNLSATLLYPGREAVARQTAENAELHYRHRINLGYGIEDCLAEGRHLRSALDYQLRYFEELHEQFGLAARLFASGLVHSFVDGLAMSAVKTMV